MAQQGTSGTPPERRYDETYDPRNPPRVLLNPRVRSLPLYTFLGGILLVFVVIGIALMYLRTADRQAESTQSEVAVGTAGDQPPGGADPRPTPGTTQDELEFRGVDDARPQGQMPPLSTTDSITRLDAFDDPDAVVGRRIDLENVLVDSREGDTVWLRDETTRVAVVVPQGTPPLQAGMRVDISGVIESTDDTRAARIRATTVNVRR
jgi:hypothetical protein